MRIPAKPPTCPEARRKTKDDYVVRLYCVAELSSVTSPLRVSALGATLQMLICVGQVPQVEHHTRVRISGRVVDECWSPLFRVAVTLRKPGKTGSAETALTNDHGEFGLLPVEAGIYDLRFEATGKLVVKTIEVSDGTDLDLGEIVLNQNSMYCPQSQSVPYKLSTVAQSLDETGLCELLQHPDRFNHEILTVRARIKIAFEDFEADVTDCGRGIIGAVWLEYGRGPKRQPTIWCCGDMTPRDPLEMIQNDAIREFHRYLTAQRTPCTGGGCYKYQVTTTLTGRFDTVPVEPCANKKSMCCP